MGSKSLLARLRKKFSDANPSLRDREIMHEFQSEAHNPEDFDEAFNGSVKSVANDSEGPICEYQVSAKGAPWAPTIDMWSRDPEYIPTQYKSIVGFGGGDAWGHPIKHEDVLVEPYYGPYRDNFQTMSDDKIKELALPLQKDNFKALLDGSKVWKPEDRRYWSLRDFGLGDFDFEGKTPKDIEDYVNAALPEVEKHCGSLRKTKTARNKCVDELMKKGLQQVKREYNDYSRWKKNYDTYNVTPEMIMSDPMMYTEHPISIIRNKALKLVNGEE